MTTSTGYQPGTRIQIKEFRSGAGQGNVSTVIVGFPEAGLVGTIASSYLIEQLKLEERGYIDSDLMPQVMIIHNSTVRYPIHIFGKDEFSVVLSEVPLPPRLSAEVAREISAWARAREAKVVIGVSGVPSRRREESQAEGKPMVLGVGSEEKTVEMLKGTGAQPFEEGLMTGFYASLIKYCGIIGQPNVTLLAESLIQFPDPAAAAAVIEVLSSLLSLKLDTGPLLRESEEIRLRMRELMQQTQQQTDRSAAEATYR